MSFERKDFLSPLFVFLSLDSWIPILIKGYNPMFFIFVLQLPHFGEETPFKMAPVFFFFFFPSSFVILWHFFIFWHKMFLCIQPHGKWYLETKIWEEKLHLQCFLSLHLLPIIFVFSKFLLVFFFFPLSHSFNIYLFGCGMWLLVAECEPWLQHVGSSSLNRDWTQALCTGSSES